MSNFNSSDEENHTRLPFHSKIHLCEPQSQPDATGFSEPEADAINANPSGFTADFVAEHSASGVVTAPSRHLPGSFHTETATVPKSAKA